MTTQPRLESLVCPHPHGQHRMAWWSWGAQDAAHVVVCVHGLTRQGRDFDRLAQALVQRSAAPLQVICPDVVGRGQSEWLSDPMGYQVPQYAADMLALLGERAIRAPIGQLDWVGTSMGGLIGMVLAGQPGLPLPSPIRRLLLNDVGPVSNWPAILAMKEYVGRYGVYASEAEAALALRALSTGFGPVPDAEWLELTRPMLRPVAGGLTLHYDPALGESVRQVTPEIAQQAEAALWGLYDQIRAETLLIRGQDSQLLSPETAEHMTRRGPQARCEVWPGVGHAPTLTLPEQIDSVARFLLG